MQIQKLADYTAQILLDYYENRIQPFLDACDEDEMCIRDSASATEANTLCFVSCFQEESFLLVFILYTKHPGISTDSKIFHIFIPSRNFLILQNQLHRAVIRSQHRCVDLRILQSVFQTF